MPPLRRNQLLVAALLLAIALVLQLQFGMVVEGLGLLTISLCIVLAFFLGFLEYTVLVLGAAVVLQYQPIPGGVLALFVLVALLMWLLKRIVPLEPWFVLLMLIAFGLSLFEVIVLASFGLETAGRLLSKAFLARLVVAVFINMGIGSVVFSMLTHYYATTTHRQS